MPMSNPVLMVSVINRYKTWKAFIKLKKIHFRVILTRYLIHNESLRDTVSKIWLTG